MFDCFPIVNPLMHVPNGQIHFKNLAAKCCKRCVWPFWDIMHWRVKDELQEPAVSFLTILTENQFWPASFKVSIFSWRHLDQRRHGNHSSAFSYLLRVYNGNNRTVWNLFEVNIWHRSGVFIVNFEQISHIVLVFPLLT